MEKGAFDNPAYQGTFEIEERPQNSFSNDQNVNQPGLPRADDLIYVCHFEDPADQIFQVEQGGMNKTWGERALAAPAANCCNWCLAELFGLLKVPFVVLFVVLGQIIL